MLICGDLLVDSKKILKDACVEISGNRITGIKKRESGDLDFRGEGSIVFPGLLDIHVHLRGLELSYKEDEVSGTLAALKGCLCGVADMPNTKPPLKTPEALEMKLKSIAENSFVDYAVYAGIPLKPEVSRELAKKPIIGFKVYPEDLERRESLCEVMREAESRDLVIVVHAEHPMFLRVPDYGYERRFLRSCEAEELAVLEIEKLAERCRARPRIHITHVSCSRTLEIAKAFGFTTDVTPHHLLFSQEEFPHIFSPYCESKVNPPLRDSNEKVKLWREIFAGLVDAIASDHAPHALEEKAFLDPALCSPGFSSLEAWSGVIAKVFYRAGALDLFAKLVAEGPAKVFGLKEFCGLEKGCLASLSVFSLKSQVREPIEYSKAKLSPYLNIEKLECLNVLIKGKIALLREKVLMKRGSGENLVLLKR
ncbi:MAG: dihydroorotase [Acidilobaceae archaeon]